MLLFLPFSLIEIIDENFSTIWTPMVAIIKIVKVLPTSIAFSHIFRKVLLIFKFYCNKYTLSVSMNISSDSNNLQE